MPKFMQSLGPENYHRLLSEAKARDVTVQALIRTVIVPEWLKNVPVAHTSIQTTTPSPITVQPPAMSSMLTRTGIVTDQARRNFLNGTFGRTRT